ncbi:putative leucine-rich repeat domain superfamily [Helianthus anomalus]
MFVPNCRRCSLPSNLMSFVLNVSKFCTLCPRCRNLTRLKVRSCRQLTDIAFAKNCNNLKWFSCGSFAFGSKGINTVINNCSLLEELSVKRLRGIGNDHVDGLVESHCQNLEMLHILKTPDCSNLGLVSVAENCKLLRKLHIDGWKMNRINDEWLIGVSKYCVNLQEFMLIGVDCTRLCIKSWPVSYLGMDALAGGCPNLVKVKVNKCRGVTSDGVSWLGILNTENILLLFNGGQVMREREEGEFLFLFYFIFRCFTNSL